MGREILVNAETLDQCARTLSTLSASFEDLAGVLNGISAQAATIEYRVKAAPPVLRGTIAAPHHGGVRSAIASYALTLSACGGYAGRLGAGVRQSAQTFEQCERQIAVGLMRESAVEDALGTGAGFFGASAALSGILPEGGETDSGLGLLGEILGGGLLGGGLLSRLKEGITGEILGATTVSGTFEAGGEMYGYHSDTVDVSALYANVSAEGSAGMYRRDADGNLIFSPYATGGVMVGFGVLSATWSDSIGNDMLGAYGSTDVQLLTGAAGATGTVAMFDADGNFNPTASVNASAEATVASASVEGGVTVAGVDVKGSAEASIGIGAHANVGYEDGVVSFDIGAAVGIGASVSLSVDVGGAVNAVTGAAESFFKSLF